MNLRKKRARMKEILKEILMMPVVVAHLFYYGWWKAGIRDPSLIREAYLDAKAELELEEFT